ncbi:MAG TPA: 3-isopropylmalate dehydrogenase, partial [Planctomycetes bacterium]|nr:3-isopropylmalate dehydrogenase [Planctomycetota bacterium]
EPIHGSSPRDAGKDCVNPMAAVLSAAMMCDWLGTRFSDERLRQIATSMEQAVSAHLAAGKAVTFDLGGEAKCSEVGDSLVGAVKG